MDAQFLLVRLLDTLTSHDTDNGDWGSETAVAIWRMAIREESLQIAPSERSRAGLTDYLAEAFLHATKAYDSVRTLKELAELGSASHPLTTLAKALAAIGPKTEVTAFGHSWVDPMLSDLAIDRLQQEPKTQDFVERFITNVLPFSNVRYSDHLGAFLNRISTRLAPAYRVAIAIIATPGGPHDNIEALVAAACGVENPDFDWIIDQFAKAEAEADQWFNDFAPKYRQVEEHEIDAAYADHLFNEPSDQYYNSETGLEAVVAARLDREGIAWIHHQAHRELLIRHAAKLIEKRRTAPPPIYLQTLVELGGRPGEVSVWDAVRKHWDKSLRDPLIEAITQDVIGNKGLRHGLLKTFFQHVAEPMSVLKSLLGRMNTLRRLELLVDMMEASLSVDSEDEETDSARESRSKELLSNFPASETSLGDAIVSALLGSTVLDTVSRLSGTDKSLLASVLLNAPDSLGQVLVCLAAAAGVDASAKIDQLLATDDSVSGVRAVHALILKRDESARAKLHTVLQHGRYQVRAAAMEALLPAAKTSEDRKALLFLAEDPSADIRLIWAERMAQLRWPESVPTLVHLLEDKRNFNSDPGFDQEDSWPQYSVARAAARALEAYKELPKAGLDALIHAATREDGDPFVACAAIGALARKSDPRIPIILSDSLASSGLGGSPKHRPLAQAAAWAIFDRALAQKDIDGDLKLERAVVDANAWIAGPVIAALSLSAEHMVQKVSANLQQRKLTERVELLHVARAILCKTPIPGAPTFHAELTKMLDGDVLSNNVIQSLRKWSLSLDANRDVQYFTAWLANKGCKLPVKQKVGDPRKYDLPERIGHMSLRSLTPFREANHLTLDDGR